MGRPYDEPHPGRGLLHAVRVGCDRGQGLSGLGVTGPCDAEVGHGAGEEHTGENRGADQDGDLPTGPHHRVDVAGARAPGVPAGGHRISPARYPTARTVRTDVAPQLAAQVVHVGVHGAEAVGVGEGSVAQLLAGEGALGPPGQHGQHVPLGAGELDRAAVGPDRIAALDVQPPLAEAHEGGGVGVAAPQGAQAGQQLLELDRLDHVVLRARVQARDPVVHRPVRRQDEHGCGVADPAQSRHEVEAVPVGESAVEDEHVEGLGQRGTQAVVPVPGGPHPVALPAQAARQELGQDVVVLDQQDRRRSLLACCGVGTVCHRSSFSLGAPFQPRARRWEQPDRSGRRSASRPPGSPPSGCVAGPLTPSSGRSRSPARRRHPSSRRSGRRRRCRAVQPAPITIRSDLNMPSSSEWHWIVLPALRVQSLPMVTSVLLGMAQPSSKTRPPSIWTPQHAPDQCSSAGCR